MFMCLFSLPIYSHLKGGSSKMLSRGFCGSRGFQSELIFGKGMRTATFHFLESGGSLNRPDLFTELPSLPIH